MSSIFFRPNLARSLDGESKEKTPLSKELYNAICCRNLLKVPECIDRGADLNDPNYTPLVEACQTNNVGMVQLILQHLKKAHALPFCKYVINMNINGCAPLITACNNNNLQMVTELMRYGSRRDNYGVCITACINHDNAAMLREVMSEPDVDGKCREKLNLNCTKNDTYQVYLYEYTDDLITRCKQLDNYTDVIYNLESYRRLTMWPCYKYGCKLFTCAYLILSKYEKRTKTELGHTSALAFHIYSFLKKPSGLTNGDIARLAKEEKDNAASTALQAQISRLYREIKNATTQTDAIAAEKKLFDVLDIASDTE